ncbi:MAG TPA: FKBP-type peptidyl-prolyl cis-trans isomerase [Candidatus Sulfotelmatobacter sp.]|nr:FKBP-type peptidyl-prolyl cis-trans isomerase [Candidatus Sulfotelmatobacter sp.]
MTRPLLIAAALVAALTVPALAAKTVTLPDGLKYMDLKVGKGPVPKPGQTAVVTYVGTFPNGKKFDASADHGGTFSFPLGQHQVISCWDEAVATMHVGGHRKIVCPPAIAYGPRGAGGVIPPNATLDFDIVLVGVK